MIEYLEVRGDALLAERRRLMQPVQAIPTPWASWNHACRGAGGQVGLALGWHVLIAARSGEGKSFVADNIAAAALQYGESPTLHSLEMDWSEQATRVLAILSGQPAWKLSPGKHFDPNAYDAARRVADECRGTLRINRGPMSRLSDILDGMRSCYEEHGSRLHIIDYLQLAWTGDARNRYDRITEVSHAVRALAKELRVVTVGLSQLNREGAKGGTPQKESMDGGGPLEADSDQVLLLDHSRKRPAINAAGVPRGWIGWVVLDKNRHGPQAEIPIRFNSDDFEMRERLEDEIQPGEIKTGGGR
jgi:replicative DNA helicase